ncbi:MAG: ArnT family glycosyltransferase [Bacteroidota bacterium]
MGSYASFLFGLASEKKYRSIQLIALSAFILLILNKILQHGFFMDGGLYLSVAKNYARGLGTFWHPHFSKTQSDYFTEQPPLYFFVMHLFYKFLGMGFFAERIFALVCVFFTCFMIHLCWALLTDKPRASAFPLLLFMITPVIFWAYSNFVEEILMTGFVLVSVYASLHIFLRQKKVVLLIWVAAGASVLAFLTKGIQGCFALATLPCMAIAHDFRKSGRMILYSIYVFLVFVLLLFLLALLFPQSVVFFTDYANNRLEKAFVSEVHKTTGNHLYLAGHLFMELLPAGILCLLLWLVARKKPALAVWLWAYF